MKIDCISDLHGFRPELEGGDLLIISGDLTARDTWIEYEEFDLWIQRQAYNKKIVVAGNHDSFIEYTPWGYDNPYFTYLRDSGTEFEGLKIWGTPWTKTFPGMNPHCKAFTCDTEQELAEKWTSIPDDIDILISHCPFLHILDQNRDGYSCGSYELRKVVDRVKPRLFICGHIHEQGGNQLMYKHVGKNTWCINASHVDENYKPTHNPVRIVL